MRPPRRATGTPSGSRVPRLLDEEREEGLPIPSSARDSKTIQPFARASGDHRFSCSERARAGFAGERPLDEALAGYQSARDRARIPMWEFTVELASFAPPKPEERVLFEALAGNQAETDRFLGMMTGATPIKEYLSPGNLRKVIGLRGFAKIE